MPVVMRVSSFFFIVGKLFAFHIYFGIYIIFHICVDLSVHVVENLWILFIIFPQVFLIHRHFFHKNLFAFF